VPDGIAPGFTADIQPLFTARDITSMQWAFNLADYRAVREHAQAILAQLSAGRMPCYGAWSKQRISLFERWIDTGMQP